jgi:hypothetical protein
LQSDRADCAQPLAALGRCVCAALDQLGKLAVELEVDAAYDRFEVLDALAQQFVLAHELRDFTGLCLACGEQPLPTVLEL